MEQREIDNMLLSMIQKHFPSLPLSDEYTDWGKWLGFARAVYESGRASPASAPEGWKIVPVEPTEEMLKKSLDLTGRAWQIYRWMVAAAPTPPVSEGVDPVMTKEELIAAAESIGMCFPGASIPPVSEDRWLPIETAPKDGIEVWCFNGEHCVMRWISGEGYALWVYVDPLRSDADPEPEQPSHWMPLPEAPAMQEDKQ